MLRDEVGGKGLGWGRGKGGMRSLRTGSMDCCGAIARLHSAPGARGGERSWVTWRVLSQLCQLARLEQPPLKSPRELLLLCVALPSTPRTLHSTLCWSSSHPFLLRDRRCSALQPRPFVSRPLSQAQQRVKCLRPRATCVKGRKAKHDLLSVRTLHGRTDRAGHPLARSLLGPPSAFSLFLALDFSRPTRSALCPALPFSVSTCHASHPSLAPRCRARRLVRPRRHLRHDTAVCRRGRGAQIPVDGRDSALCRQDPRQRLCRQPGRGARVSLSPGYNSSSGG